MKWQNDLVRDIRFHDDRDDIDDPRKFGYKLTHKIHKEFSDDNAKILSEVIDRFKPQTYVEIGVHRNGQDSSTCIIHSKMRPGDIYLGVDLEDKSFLHSENIYTIKTNSSNYQAVTDYMNEIGMKSIDLLFIDGWHSINQVLDDWEYSRLLSKNGVVCFHDTTFHFGPKMFLENLSEKYIVEKYCEHDYGIGVCYEA